MALIDELLSDLAANHGSDLHLSAGMAPCARIRGEIHPLAGSRTLEDHELRPMLVEVAGVIRWERFEHEHDLDFAYELAGTGRFRVNCFLQHRGAGAVFRSVPAVPPTPAELGLPPAVERFAELSKGLVLVTGPSGSGKTTSLAALVDLVNQHHAKHIITIEDPLEFVHENKRSVVSHREVGTHARSFEVALRAALRQNPDVILIGELRGKETIALALAAAELGVLVFAALPTKSAPRALDRLIESFPPHEQPEARLALAESLAGIVSQALFRRADGPGQCVAVEVLLRTNEVVQAIREGQVALLSGLIHAGRDEGMQLMDDSLEHLVKAGAILPRDAYYKAQDRARFDELPGVAAGGCPSPPPQAK